MNVQAHTPHDAEAALFDQILSCDALLPVDFIPGAGPGRLAHAESLLRSLAVIEDLSIDERQHEHDDLPAQGLRMEAKLDLSLLLLGRVLEHARPPLHVRSLRWSLRGARVHLPHTTPMAGGTEGVLQLQLYDWLPEPMELPAYVLAADPARVWLRFSAFPPRLSDAIERHLFRQHRRQIAQARMTSICESMPLP